MVLNIYNVISIIAIFQSAFLSSFFFSNPKGIRLGNKILGGILSIFAIYIAFAFSMSFGAGKSFIKYYNLLFVLSQLAFLLGPLLYLYAQSLVDPQFRIKKTDLLHAIPFFVAILLAIVETFFLNYQLEWESPLRKVTSIAVIIHIIAYVVASLIIMKSKIGSLFSPIDDGRLAWLRLLLLGYIVFWFFQLHFFVFVDLWKLYGLCPYSNTLYLTTIFIFFNCIAYVAMKNPEIFTFKKKYQKSDLRESDKAEFRKKILEAMESEKIYRESALTLSSLSKRLSIPVTYLSQIVNESFNQNFCDFVNHYRIEESKQHLKRQSVNRQSVLEVAYAVGFNSKSSFNSAFKKQTGITPREYMKCGQ